ncbi:signal transduction histidine kinase [Methylorubrum rhodinum]|uniref:histidine kinase n=1 Tax=Methylorubrum rhodinum TaxID=29428 RepID=A0A840ZP39_9HYPH|nr:ATP-binding protein [Methylorubrum rhodinum]MBB5760022.1 signal transduction histidine kinase [Methylorubrum rhodinum]
MKDLIGRDLITDDFVAIFELVKNSFDAYAKSVRITFSPQEITIADNGKGMTHADILQKWLFVAYSAKREGTEDEGYRDKIGQKARTYAGAKGVGRFSCDRLGSELELISRTRGGVTQILDVDWRRYEQDSQEEFDEVEVELGEADGFPPDVIRPHGAAGTILRIRRLRATWDRDKLQRLKRELTKLIDPFGSDTKPFEVEIIAPGEAEADRLDEEWNRQRRDEQALKLIVNGRIENPIMDVLRRRTTLIQVRLSEDGKWIDSRLEDRGDLVYHIRESNPYPLLQETALTADIYFLNRSAKIVFAHRMGVPSVQFGSIFLFRNGFRVFPIGTEDDDFFGLNRRKQQGQRRFLGGRDVIGRVEIRGVDGFDEVTSRSHGLIETPNVEALVTCIRDKCIRRLERYVVDITWKDKFDQEADDTSRIRKDESSALVSLLVSRLAATEGVELLEYNPELVRIVDEKSEAFESSLKALELLADRTGDRALQERVVEARERIKALEVAEAQAREASRRAEARAAKAENTAAVATLQFHEEKERNAFLVAAGSLDQDTILNLHHQIIMHASDVQQGVKRMMGRLRGGAQLSKEDWIGFLEQVSFRNSQILTAARFATKGGYKQQSSHTEADLCVYVRDYIETISNLWAPRGIEVTVETDSRQFVRRFRPIEIGIVIDNLVANAAKAGATTIGFFLSTSKGSKPTLEMEVADDGTGWPAAFDPPSRAFEKGVTTTDGSGLGLFHVRQVIEGLDGTIEVSSESYSDDLDGAHLTIRIPS